MGQSKFHTQGHRGRTTTGSGTGQAKKRTRAIKRLFQKDGGSLPQNVRAELERELIGLSSTIRDHELHKTRSQMISKYHMVRFFDLVFPRAVERRKAERLVKRIRTYLREASDPNQVESLEADLHVAQVDVHYTKYHPHLKPYVSLYSKAGSINGSKGLPHTPDESSAILALRSERPLVWKEVEEAVVQGEDALVRLRERQRDESEKTKPAKQPALGKGTAGQAADEGPDGFFDE
ncbi:hypothetical protein MKZ38_007568 [Zalerion maritima]|uniref:rRNA-processing protein EFG1 n=1 Tax=Zalerion maritima TaxID=339359 RepID=A0AAD5WU47_9PEZI|nr:hypothetical protein MKZ38_007568 [Zalerion maritima]